MMFQVQRKRREIGVPNDAFLVLSVGELNKNKNHQIVVRAIAEIGDTNIHYAIAGKGDQEKSLKNIANNLGISEQIHILGYRDDISLLYCCADLCAFPSIREGLEMAAIEGMCCKLPLVLTQNRGTNEFLSYGTKVCQAYDVNAFAASINDLYRDEVLRIKMGMVNKEFSTRFDAIVVDRIMKKIYEGIM